MLEKELLFERDLFFLLNGSDSTFLDSFMWLYSGKVVWLPLAAFILFVLVYKKDWRESILILLSIVLVITLCDQFASHFCKPVFARYRPTHHPDFMNQVKIVFDYRSGLYGFISSHAANAFGFAMFMSLLLKNKLFTCTIFSWSVLSAYTRIYLGVHFISDVVCGMLAGIFLGYVVYKLYLYARNTALRSYYPINSVDTIYSTKEKRLIVYSILISVLFILTFAKPLVKFLR